MFVTCVPKVLKIYIVDSSKSISGIALKTRNDDLHQIMWIMDICKYKELPNWNTSQKKGGW